MDLVVTRALDSLLGRLIMCDESLRVRFGLAGVSFSVERSAPPARFARRRRRLDGRVSCSSKSVGRKAAGALWKSTTVGADRRFDTGAVRKFPCDTLWTLLPYESSERVLLVLEKLGERREKLLAMLAMLSFRITEFADARIWFSTLRFDMPGNGKTSFVHTSSMAVSRRTRSALLGARVGMLLDERSDCERLTIPGENVGGESSGFCA